MYFTTFFFFFAQSSRDIQARGRRRLDTDHHPYINDCRTTIKYYYFGESLESLHVIYHSRHTNGSFTAFFSLEADFLESNLLLHCHSKSHFLSFVTKIKHSSECRQKTCLWHRHLLFLRNTWQTPTPDTTPAPERRLTADGASSSPSAPAPVLYVLKVREWGGREGTERN